MEHRRFEPPFLAYLRRSIDSRPLLCQGLINQLLHDVYDGQMVTIGSPIEPLTAFDVMGQNIVAMFYVSRVPIGPRELNATLLEGWRFPFTPMMWEAIHDVINSSLESQAAEDHLNPMHITLSVGDRALVLLAPDEADQKHNLFATYIVHRSMSPLSGLTLLAAAANDNYGRYRVHAQLAAQGCMYT